MPWNGGSGRRRRNLERRIDLLSQKEAACENREKAILQRESQLNEKHERADRMLEEQTLKLEQIAGITSEEAKNFLVQAMEVAAKRDAALMIRKIEEEARRTADNTGAGDHCLCDSSATQVIM